MQRGIRGRAQALAVIVGALVALVAVPSIASATTITSGSAVQTQRSSWVNYFGMFGGTFTAFGGATYAANTAATTDDTLTFVFDRTNSTYNITSRAGSGTIAFTGGISYTLTAHYIDLDISDPRVSITRTTDTAAVVSAVVSYDPYETSGPQIVNPTTPTRIDLYTLDLSAGFSGLGTARHSWANAPAYLTAAGANAFNGGINGSYRTGDQFGTFALSGSY